jgi:hypothetical protein
MLSACPEPPGRRGRDAVDDTGHGRAADKARFEASSQAALEQHSRSVAEFAATAASVGAQRRAVLEPAVRAARRRQAVAAHRLREVRDGSTDAWEARKAAVVEAIDSLSHAVHDLQLEFTSTTETRGGRK